jgi:tRNA pseudouridine38-40 synthase
MRYLVELSYKGTDYVGWQRQPNGMSVQQKIEEVLSVLLRETIGIIGSSRTDSGVHARQQFAHFDTQEVIAEPEKIVFRANKMLPSDIALSQIKPVAEDTHSRFDANFRKYEYYISHKKDVFRIKEAYFYDHPLNVEAMNEACGILFQHIDFECFSRIRTDVKTFNCTIMEAQWSQTTTGLMFCIKANRFLRGMVRAIVGTMLDVGTGKISVQDFEQIILSKDRKKAGRAVPPDGLFLVEVNY